MIGELEVYDSSPGRDVFVGTLFSMLRRGVLSTTFVYDPSYLSDASSYAIDPQLPLSISPIHFSGLPGALREFCKQQSPIFSNRCLRSCTSKGSGSGFKKLLDLS